MCVFDSARVSPLSPETERWTAFGRGTWQIASGHELFAEYLFSRTRMRLAFTPTPVSSSTTIDGTPVLYPQGGPYYPTEYAAQHGIAGPLAIEYRTLPLGPRTNVVTTDAQRLVVGAQGMSGPWSYGAGYSRSENRAEDKYASGYVLASRIIPALATGLVNPFGESAQAGLDLLASTQFQGVARSAKGVVDQVDGQVSRDWLTLPGGALAVALGTEARREKLDDRPAPILDTGDVIGSPFEISPQSASRNVAAAFGEASMPFAKGWELLASVRYDHYSDFGGTTNPKVALRWQPTKSLLMRASWGTGFRAPTLPDLHTQQFTSITNFLERSRALSGHRHAKRTAAAANTRRSSAAIPTLKPETSKQATAGLVWEPVPGSRSARIGGGSKGGRHRQPVLPTKSWSKYDVYGASHVVRGPADPGLSRAARADPRDPFLQREPRRARHVRRGCRAARADGRGAVGTTRVRRWTAPTSTTFTSTLPGLDSEHGAGRYGLTARSRAGATTRSSRGSSARGTRRWRSRSSRA